MEREYTKNFFISHLLINSLFRIILDRVADSLVLEDYDFDASEDEDLSDASEDEDSSVAANTPAALLKRKRELIDNLADEAEGDEAFGRVLSELSGFQPPESSRKKNVSLNLGSAANATGGNNAKKRSRPLPPTSGSKFNRLSPHTQAMRTGIISDDEASGSHAHGNAINDIAAGYTDSEDFLGLEGEEAELAQLKKVRRLSNSNSGAAPSINSLLNTPVKEESAVLKVIQVPFDAEGNAILPLSLNMITVHSLGQVVHDRPAYHNKRYILPVGFTTARSYLSVISPEASCNYFSTILDNGPAPLYQVTPEGHPEMAFQSASTTGAWAAVAKAAAAIRGKDSAPSVSGPDYFGLANPTVSMLIERLPNADKCESYVQKKYEVSNLVGGKHVKTAATSTSSSTNVSGNANTNVPVAAVHVDIDTESQVKEEANDTDIQMN